METHGNSLAIVGGGAAGLAAAVAAGDYARQQGRSLSISLYERDDRVGRSILATGNGRCNFSNAAINADLYRNAPFVAEAFQGLEDLYGTDDAVHEFFRSLGLVWREESEGRQYPLANKASAVLDVLRAAAAQAGVRECCESDVAAVDGPRAAGKPFTLRMSNGVLKRAGAVVVACGGRTVSALGGMAIERIPPKPVLGPLAVVPRDKLITRELDKIRVRAQVSLLRPGQEEPVAVEAGEMMFRKYGVSGICIFNLSRFARPGDRLAVNFLEGREGPQAEAMIQERWETLSRRFPEGLTYGDLLRGLLLPRVAEAVVKSRFINPYNRVEPEQLPALTELLTAFPLEVESIAEPQLCQVRRGGFSVDACDGRTMEVRGARGLFLCGEALDVDGPCGGYNLHWAWSSAMIAGRCAAGRLLGAAR